MLEAKHLAFISFLAGAIFAFILFETHKALKDDFAFIKNCYEKAGE